MTIEEAINELVDYVAENDKLTISFETVTMARKAMEKQMSKKPKEVEKKYWNDYVCPKCEKLLGNTIEVYQEKCCHYCGQALNWSEVEEC
jgi:hypothetical protein